MPILGATLPVKMNVNVELISNILWAIVAPRSGEQTVILPLGNKTEEPRKIALSTIILLSENKISV